VSARHSDDVLTYLGQAANCPCPLQQRHWRFHVGVFSGSISYSKFFVRGDVPKRFQAPFMKAIRLRTFVPLEVDSDEDVGVGFCAPGNALDLDLSQDKVVFNEYVVLGFRIDQWRIPRTLFRAHYDAAEAELKAKLGKEKLGKKDKDELKFRIQRRLRKKVLPNMRAFDLLWDTDRKVLLFWNRSPRMKEELMALFEQTFHLRLDEVSPYVAAKALLDDDQVERLQELEASSFLDVPEGA
jgi:recombination associated protein RdgC